MKFTLEIGAVKISYSEEVILGEAEARVKEPSIGCGNPDPFLTKEDLERLDVRAPKMRALSAESRQKMADAQKRRWAKVKAERRKLRREQTV